LKNLESLLIEGVICGHKAQIGRLRIYDLPLSIASVPNAVELLNFTQTSSDAWGDVENCGELFGKTQNATLRKNSKPRITATFAQIGTEGWHNRASLPQITEVRHGDGPPCRVCSYSLASLTVRKVYGEWCNIHRTHFLPLKRI
jgi:hypothetical protein